MNTSAHYWRRPSDRLSLAGNDVHVWIAALDQPAAAIEQLAEILSDGEERIAERFCFDRDKRRYIAARGLLRSIVAKYYLGVEPGRLEFSYGSHGKPCLSRKLGGGTLCFNQSDSNGLALYAFAQDHEVGVDIEYMRTMTDAKDIVDGCFSEHEKRAFDSVADEDKTEAFFNCWTRKEAFIKAIGLGLHFPLDRFDVSFVPGEPARLLRLAGWPEEVCRCRWTLMGFTPKNGYKGALAIKSTECKVSYWRFPGLDPQSLDRLSR